MKHKCHISAISDESLQGFQLVIEQNGLVFAQQSQDAAQACLPASLLRCARHRYAPSVAAASWKMDLSGLAPQEGLQR